MIQVGAFEFVRLLFRGNIDSRGNKPRRPRTPLPLNRKNFFVKFYVWKIQLNLFRNISSFTGYAISQVVGTLVHITIRLWDAATLHFFYIHE